MPTSLDHEADGTGYCQHDRVQYQAWRCGHLANAIPQEPRHYTQGHIECFDAIDAIISNPGRLDHYRANVLKYLWRCFDKGDTVTDLKKARWYLNRLIDELEK